ncbi:membrane protein [Salipiger pallidus]|uniref:Membrane protein n=1 Tax=Salipiger pallidus TaxID=1775170 RepID=A0A8J2ZJ31_9RHOB|nr:MipA/OmpV family protein [Salipiger pallidus]GGG70406.1 membrane protein [Salipiger pallidus]
MKPTRTALALSTALVALPVIAAAQSGEPGLMFSLRGGLSVAPEYFGSDDYAVGPDLGFKFHGLTLRNGRSFGAGDPWSDRYGWNIHGAFRFIGERDASDFDDLRGMDDVDAALELGFGFGYTSEYFSGYTDFRRGFGGHEAWVGEAGADLIARPNDRWKLSVGPRLNWGGNDFVDTYFGVDGDEATATRGTFNPDAGLYSAGVEMGATYRLNDDWGIEGAVTWEQYQGDAADSPIVESGSDDNWTLRLGVTRNFHLRF